MPNFLYSSSGLIKLSSCFTTDRNIFIPYKYVEGSILYLRSKATKGILEKITIRNVKIILDRNVYTPIYYDSYNWAYNENELCIESDAFALAESFYKNKIYEIDNYINSICSRVN